MIKNSRQVVIFICRQRTNKLTRLSSSLVAQIGLTDTHTTISHRTQSCCSYTLLFHDTVTSIKWSKSWSSKFFGPLLNFDLFAGDSAGQFLYMMTLKIAPRQVYPAAVTPMEPAVSQMDTAMGWLMEVIQIIVIQMVLMGRKRSRKQNTNIPVDIFGMFIIKDRITNGWGISALFFSAIL